MDIRIFDVTHGFCALAIADNMNMKLIDCGCNEKTGFRPSSYLLNTGCTGIEELIIQNFDEDHIQDLPNLIRAGNRIPIASFTRNRSLTPEQLRSIKLSCGQISEAMKYTLALHEDYVAPGPAIDFAGLHCEYFFNTFPAFSETNNLSLVTFLRYEGLTVLFPGDLEKRGWEALLKDNRFREWLGTVNIFIASHHGRENGYCPEVFRYCQPNIAIISDKEVVYETQKQDYAKHTSGIVVNRFNNPGLRHVLTTRRDGMITIRKQPGNAFQIETTTATPAHSFGFHYQSLSGVNNFQR